MQGQAVMVKGRGPLFGIEIDGERKNFLNRADAEQIQAAVVAQGGKAVIFEHSEAEIISREAPAAEGLFFDLGMQYYIAARSSAVLGVWLMPVCGNLYHHAVEMSLKAGLSRKYSLRDLANPKKFGHCLPKIWEAFTAEFASSALRQFDTMITTLERWDEIRYPDKVLQAGAAMEVEWIETSSPTALPPSPPKYKVNGTEIDNFVITIFDVLQRLPGMYKYQVKSNPQLRELLTKYHANAEQIWGA